MTTESQDLGLTSHLLLVWLSTEAVAFFFTPRPPFFPLLASFVSSHLLRDSLCTALQTRRLWIWSTGLSTQLTPSSRREAWVPGNLSVLTGRSQPAIRWTRGRGGKSYVWRLFPWRTLKISTYSVHDNRYFADWIKLCPGLSKNSEDGNSCPKSHKAARFGWGCGKSGQHWDWDYYDEAHGFASENWCFRRPEWTERIAVKVCSCSPQRQNKSILSFLAPPCRPRPSWINYPGKSAAVRLSGFLPYHRHYSPPPINCPDRFVPPGLSSGSATSAVINGAGPDGC